MFANVNRYGGGLSETVAGPVVGAVGDLNTLVTGNILQAINGQDTNIGAEAVNFAQRYMPGSSIWYARLALERTIFDQARQWTDPKANSKIRRTLRKRQRDYKQGYWWAPGKMSPSRSPDLGNVNIMDFLGK